LYVRHKVCEQLDPYIDYLWFLSDVPPHARERILPSGTLELVINLADDEIRVYDAACLRRYRGAVASGAFRRCFVIDTREHASIIGAHFRPGGAVAPLGVPADELVDRHVELESLWSFSEASLLREQLCAATTATHRFHLLEQALLTHLLRARKRPRLSSIALPFMQRSGASIREIARAVGLSHRYFIQSFEDEVGMTPKLFLRVQRFQRVLTMAAHGKGAHWAQVAEQCGYFDQSHLIRDFVSFAGITPAQFTQQRSDQVKDNHVPLAD